MLLFGNQAQSSSAGLDSQFHDLHLGSRGDLPPSVSYEPVSSESQNPSSALVTDATNQILDLVNSYNPKFVIEYHLRALLDPCILTREEYFQLTAVEMTRSFIDDCPWHPFASRNDFELAEHILRTRLNREGRDSLFKVLKTQAGDHQSAYTINNESDFKEAWSKAENLLTKFTKETLTLDFRGEALKYDVHFRPLWEWTLNLLSDEALSPLFVWDAVKIFQLDEKTNEQMRIFNEPWTGDLLWEVQSSLPPGGKPLAYILYADKTRLSSFGTAKGYPVMARIANLPDAICNGKGWGGGTVVGWLPIVEDDPKHKGKPAWINFKRVVWHKSFRKIIQSVAEYSHTGYAFKLPHSGKVIVIYPFIFILSADYEEHCMMTLICGTNSASPCPVCLVPNGELQDLLDEHPLWTTKEMQDLYNLVEEEGEEVLDESKHVERISGPQKCAAKVAIDELIRLMNYSIANFPRWRNLKHFDNVTTFDFGDGVKFEHMSKQLLFAVHSVLRKEVHHDAYLLLKVIQSYVELDMYASMDVHTEKSIEEGRHLMNVFDAKLKAYSRATDDKQFKNPTSWKIPKVHTQQHFFNDIIAKGATKNYNTKVNESMHGPLKKAYQIQTNFKDVAEQILRTDHRYNIIMQIRQQIDRQKKHQEEENDDLSEDKNHIRQNQRIGTLDSKAMLHSLQATPKDPRTVGELENAFRSDPAYGRFHIRLGRFMTAFIKRVDEDAVAQGGFIKYMPDDTIQIYQTLTVTYQSLVNLKESADLLRCSPSFYNHPRYDGVIINTDKGAYIGQLIQLFECEYLEQRYPLALVHPFDLTVTDGGECWKFQRDKDLGLYRLRARPRVFSQIVSIYSIIRGVLLVKDNSSDLSNGQDYFVVDTIDTDMFFRMKRLTGVLKYRNVASLKKD
ncbi:hypothetical protein IW261DRAFT_1425114 [Armillaria novae-zelandiae]|uniref:Uncharacterized protein n=1 Tax=Armillaria novae-zelandiae TaxID=153914 RepID=A0AA39NTA9_9AGAR|nr:hypothetical protein IW261DRAFT_1425114 [Armillaria novae-zelandiae]